MQNVVIHYDEIGIKGKNRIVFEKQLMKNILAVVQPLCPKASIKRLYGRLLLTIEKQHEKEVATTLQKTFGIANFALTTKVDNDINTISNSAIATIRENLGQNQTFRITTQRSDKKFPLTSQGTSVKVGAAVVKALDLQVRLENPDITCFIEITDHGTFLYTQKIAGPGGLPVGVSGKVIVMLSGGIDSPVAAWQIMKRGAEIIPVHFHSVPFTSEFSIDKVKELVEVLKAYQPKIKFFGVPFADLQKKIMMSVPEKFRIIFYRRFMMRVVERIAQKEGAKAIVTGEALGQVASQTIENMTATSEPVSLPVLRPLIGFDKHEIIKKALDIGTLEISQQPHDDCCTLFEPKQVETKAKLSDIHAAEQNLDTDSLTKAVADAVELLD